MTHPSKTLLLVDGTSYVYRAFHAMPDLRAVPGDPTSCPTGAIRGMINMLQSLRSQVPARYVVCVFDAKGATFRHDLYPPYKTNRPPMPDDLRPQIEPILQMVRLQGWTVLSVPGVEADDVLGTLAVTAAASGLDVVISSGDKDLAQLVSERITLVDTMKGKRRDVAGVFAEFGVTPQQMRDFQALVGDTSDNVPGVPGVGPKTAAKWLKMYGSLEAIVAHAQTIGGAVGVNLRASLDWLPTGRALVTIKTDCHLHDWLPGWPDMESTTRQPIQTEALARFYQQYGFQSLWQNMAELAAREAIAPPVTSPRATGHKANSDPDLFGDMPSEPEASAPLATHPAYALDCTTILSWPVFDDWLARVQSADLVAIDTETTSLDMMQARIVGISLCVQTGQAAYIPLAHTGTDTLQQLPLDQVLTKLTPWLQDASRAKLGQHIKYDRHVFANHGIEVRGYVHDTMLESYVLEVHLQHGLASLAQRHLGRSGISFEDLCGKGVYQISFDQVTIASAALYACEDAEMTLSVHQVLWPRIQCDEKLRNIYTLEMASSEALYRVERHGVLIDAPTLAAQSQALGLRMVQLEQEAYSLAGQSFNLNSPKQIAQIFFTLQGLPIVKKTPAGLPSTDDEVLQKLAEDYPLPAKVLAYRSLAKLKGTYTDKLAQLAQPSTGRVHTHYAQAVAVTGRLSSNDPNLQNIPVRTPEGRRIREAFVAAPGHLIASADYSQIELRIMAHLSGDAALVLAFHDGMDVHRATAAEVFGIDTAHVTSEQRRCAKVINFGLIYGMSAYGLAKSLGIDNTAAKNYITRYFERYPGVKNYMDHTRALAKSQGYVETVFGRRLYLPEINSPNGQRRMGAERAAINAPMQGTAADLIKLSMVKVQQVIDAKHLKTNIIMQVHDELVFEVPQDELDWVKHEVPDLMAHVVQLKVPLLAEVGVGPNWDRAH